MIIDNIINKIKENKHYIILYTLICLLFVSLLCSMKKCTQWSDMNYTNITALTDTIKYYKSKSEQLIAQKSILVGDMNILKQVNDSLYNIIKKDIKVNSPDNVIYINTIIKDTTSKDTCWLIKQDTVNNIYNINKNFDFSDKYRTLKGYTYYNKDINNKIDTLGTVITDNNMFVDFTVVQKDNQVYISSSNPYIQYNKIIGITNSNIYNKNKKHRFGFGPYIGYGIVYTNKQFKLSPSIGLSLHYNLFSF